MNLLILLLMLMVGSVNSQTINWASFDSTHRHIFNANTGIEHGAVLGVGYGFRINNNLFPMVANLEFSVPAGDYFFDDLKTKIGMQVSWVEIHNFQFSTKVHGVIRRYENSNVRLVNFGSDLAGVIGYYRSKWFLAGEIGFDKAIITHFKHSDNYSEQYPGVKDGWYGPATGGNFYYGVQAGFSFGKHDLYARAGKLLTQDFVTAPTFPLYGQLGYNIRV